MIMGKIFYRRYHRGYSAIEILIVITVVGGITAGILALSRSIYSARMANLLVEEVMLVTDIVRNKLRNDPSARPTSNSTNLVPLLQNSNQFASARFGTTPTLHLSSSYNTFIDVFSVTTSRPDVFKVRALNLPEDGCFALVRNVFAGNRDVLISFQTSGHSTANGSPKKYTHTTADASLKINNIDMEDMVLFCSDTVANNDIILELR